MTPQDNAKIAAGKAAIDEFVFDGMKIGLGSGTTSHFFVRTLGEKVRQGLEITATTTSKSTTAIADEVGIAITDINDIGELDLTIDGPDEIDPEFRMIKGGGACLLWEKIVAHVRRLAIGSHPPIPADPINFVRPRADPGRPVASARVVHRTGRQAGR